MYQGFNKVIRKGWANGRNEYHTSPNSTSMSGGEERRRKLNEPATESEMLVLIDLLKMVLKMSHEERLKALWYTKGLADGREEKE